MAHNNIPSETNSSETNAEEVITKLLQVMARLRDPQIGCPWDLEQSYATIAPSTLEEAYEVVDAIEREDFPHLQEELGDLLFQVVFYAQLGTEEKRFTFADIANSLVDKLITRHPHVFPDGTLESRVDSQRLSNQSQVIAQWETIKQQERERKGEAATLDGVPGNLPALLRAYKLQKRAARVGFDWPDVDDVIAKIDEELVELKAALADNDGDGIEEELGDLLFSVVNVSRHLKIDPEQTLRRVNNKFEARFRYLENRLQEQGTSVDDATLTQMDSLWEEAKQAE